MQRKGILKEKETTIKTASACGIRIGQMQNSGRRYDMKKYFCEPCGYEYDPEVGDPDNGIAPGTAFEDLPEDWVCPVCGMGKEEFTEA